MKLPKVEIKKIGRKTYYFIDGKEVKPYFKNGCRKRIKYGRFLIKFNCDRAIHEDMKVYRSISIYDRRYFPKCYFDNGIYSIHEYVPHIRYENLNADVKDSFYAKAINLERRYGFGDFSSCQLGMRRDNKKLVYFDYGY